MRRDKRPAVDDVVRPTLVVTRKSGDTILKQIETGKPSQALRHLLRDSSRRRSTPS
jgi:hypothetical protein